MKIRWLGLIFGFGIIILIYWAMQATGKNIDYSTMSSMRSESGVPMSENMVGMDHKSQPSYQIMSIDELATIISTEANNYTIVNVNSRYEGEIEATDYNIPYNDLEALKAALPDKNVPVILYCRNGNMSKEASLALSALGYTQLWNVSGGMLSWQASGREIIQNRRDWPKKLVVENSWANQAKPEPKPSQRKKPLPK